MNADDRLLLHVTGVRRGAVTFEGDHKYLVFCGKRYVWISGHHRTVGQPRISYGRVGGQGTVWVTGHWRSSRRQP